MPLWNVRSDIPYILLTKNYGANLVIFHFSRQEKVKLSSMFLQNCRARTSVEHFQQITNNKWREFPQFWFSCRGYSTPIGQCNKSPIFFPIVNFSETANPVSFVCRSNHSAVRCLPIRGTRELSSAFREYKLILMIILQNVWRRITPPYITASLSKNSRGRSKTHDQQSLQPSANKFTKRRQLLTLLAA